MDLELDDEELDLELNEEDLDFALRAMEGDTSEVLDPNKMAFDAGAANTDFGATDLVASDFTMPDFETSSFKTPRFETTSFETTSFEAPNFESPDFNNASVEAPVFEAAAFESPVSEAPVFAEPEVELKTFSLDDELASLAAATTVAPASDLKDFDLSLAAEEFTAEVDFGSLETDKLEEDLGALEGLGDLDDLSFDSPDFEAPSFDTPSFDSVAADEPSAPSFAAPIEPAPVLEVATAAGDDFDFLADTDEVATKLDLARAYIDMGDTDGAKDILDEVLQEGSDVQKHEASELLERIV